MYLRDKNVLVTGADGFIGSHLVEALVDNGCNVKAFVYYNSFSSWGWIDHLPKEILSKIEIIPGDIRDYIRVNSAVKGIDIIFHLAALIGIPYSYDAPKSYVDTNIQGTLNILEAARNSSVKRILITSTSEVYGTARYVPIDEEHPVQGQSPYSASKIGADSIAESYFRSFNVPVITVRPFNTYGPRQSARAIIPTIISQLLQGREKIKLGNLSPTRDLNYVKDTVQGFICLAECEDAIGQEVNIATQKEISMGDLGGKLIEMINPDAKIIIDEMRIRPNRSEVNQLLGSNEKIRRLTGWSPNFSIDQGLQETINWFKIPTNLEMYKLEYNK